MTTIKKISFYILVVFVLVGNVYGIEQAADKIKTEELPAYFSATTWNTIKSANTKSRGKSKKIKIVAIMEAPVEYVSGLNGQNNEDIQKQIDNGTLYIKRETKHHGTAVAGLISSRPCRLPCHIKKDFSDENKLCDSNEIVVSGIAWHTKIVNVSPFLKGINAGESFKNLLSSIVTHADKKEGDENKASREVPIKMILNLSFGPISKDALIERIKEYYYKRLESSKNNNDTLVIQWAVDYVNRGMKWEKSDSDSTLWDEMEKERMAEQKIIDGTVKNFTEELDYYEGVIKDHIMPMKDSILVVVAAGNSGKRLNDSNAGFLRGKNTADDSPVIGVAAGCGEGYKKRCAGSNYGSEYIDILAPGEKLPVIFNLELGNKIVNGATYVGGTSFSAPIVVGVVSLIAQCKPTASTKEIKNAIFRSATRDSSLDSDVKDGKILDVKEAISLMCERAGAAMSDEPTYEDNDYKDEL